MLEATTVFLLESLLWKVLLEDGAVVAQFEATTAPYTTAADPNFVYRLNSYLFVRVVTS